MAATPAAATPFLSWDRTHNAGMLPLRVRCARLAVTAALAALPLIAAGCRHPKEQIADLTEEFTYTSLSFSPSSATAAGLHDYKNRNLDGQLDDMGPAAIDSQRRFYEDFNRRLQQIDPKTLNAEDQADLNNLRNRTGLALFDLVQMPSYLHNPLRYVEVLGNALYTPYIVDYAPKAERFRHISSRLRQVPLMLDQATTSIFSAPSVWTKAAIEADRGILKLVDGELRDAAPPEVRKDYDSAAAVALPAMRKFHAYMETKLQFFDNADWRLGTEAYSTKFHDALESGGTPQDLLVNTERQFDEVRARMFALALPLHRALAPMHKDHQELGATERQQAVIGEVLAKIAARHSTPESQMDDVRRDVEEARAFVQRKNLLTLPGGRNLQVMPTPEFRRNIDPVSRFQPAPALNPELSAFFFITPIPPDLSKQSVESRLRQYDFYRLKLLALSTIVPGRYTQMEAANTVQPLSRRLLRSVFGAQAYIQGWAEYSTRVMIDEGFPDQSPEMALTFAKEQLRTLADAILDVRLHMLHMTDAEALTLLERGAFEETEEAAQTLQQAKLTSCELPGYFIGAANWLAARAEYQAAARGGSPADFLDRALKLGAVPMSSLARLLNH